MNNEQFKAELSETMQALWAKYFNGSATVSRPALLGNTNLFVTFRLGNDTKEFTNGIPQNDPVNFTVILESTGNDEYELTYHNCSLSSLKPESKYYAMRSERIRTRKAKGNMPKLLKSLEKTIQKLHGVSVEMVEQDQFLELPYSPEDKIKFI